MNILHITNCLRGGGIQNFLLSLLPEQVSMGNIVTLIVIEKYDYDYCSHLESIMQKNGVSVIRLNKQRKNKISLLSTMFKCRNLVLKIKPDIVNTHGEMSHIYGAFSTFFIPSLHCITVHNAPEKWSIMNNFLNKNKPVIFCSQSAYDLKVQKNKEIAIIDNGISAKITKSKESIDLRSELGLNADDKIVVLVGSLRLQKNYDFLKDICDKLNDDTIHFCICGGNYGAGYISTDSFKKYENIHFLGLRSDISSIENGSNLFLSCATFEGLPIAVLEAYFNGIPCVLSPIPQHKNISRVYKVYIPESFDAKSFVNCINEALKNEEEHDDIYYKRKEQIAQYSISETSKRYLLFYKKILNEK